MCLRKVLFFAYVLLFSAFILMAEDLSSTVQGSSAVFRVEVRNSYGQPVAMGTGFAVGSDEIVITNAHVVEPARYNDSYSLFLTAPHREGVGDIPAIIEIYDTEMDLCVLKPDIPVGAFFELASDDPPAIGSEIVILGFPLGQSFKATPGSLQAFQDVPGIGGVLDLSAIVAPGNSGGPVLDNHGDVVGVASSTIIGLNFNFAIPARNIRSFLAGEDGRISVAVDADVDGARVFVNGRYRGVSPVEFSLPSAPFSLLVQADGREEYSEDFSGEDDVRIRPELRRTRPAEVEIRIETNPADVEVNVNNRNLGTSPVIMTAPPGKKLRIRISKNGYDNYYGEFRVSDEETQTFQIELERRGLFR